MVSTIFVRARVDQRLRDEAAAVLDDIGLTVSDVVRMTLTRIAKDKALPFELTHPNAATRAAMEESRAMMKGQARFASGEEVVGALDKAAG